MVDIARSRREVIGEIKRHGEEIKAKKGSILDYDKQIGELKDQVSEHTLQRNKLEEIISGLKADGKRFASKFTES